MGNSALEAGADDDAGSVGETGESVARLDVDRDEDAFFLGGGASGQVHYGGAKLGIRLALIEALQRTYFDSRIGAAGTGWLDLIALKKERPISLLSHRMLGQENVSGARPDAALHL